MARAAADRTEQPTPERLRRARREGQVAQSRDLPAALGLLAALAVVAGAGSIAVGRLLALFRASAAGAAAASAAMSAASADGAPLAFAAAARRAFDVAAPLVLVPLAAALAVAALAGALQTGGLVAWRAAAPDWSRLAPAAGLARVFSPATLLGAGKGLLKAAVVVAVAGASLAEVARDLPQLAGAPPSSVLAALGIVARRIAVRVVLALVALGILDWLAARRRLRRDLMMTREEVRREHKEMEGDPRHKAERQRLHRELSEQRMVDDVRKADFIVVNPDHLAVAVRYDPDAHAAPVVVAKGERLLAERIKQVAREAGVPVYRDVGLARALGELPEGDEIPEALYEAVAELLRALREVEARQRPDAPPPPSSSSSRTPPPGPQTPQPGWKRA